MNTLEENRTFEITTVGKESVPFMRSAEEPVAYEKEIDRYRNPRLVDWWAGKLDVGFATSQGNAKA